LRRLGAGRLGLGPAAARRRGRLPAAAHEHAADQGPRPPRRPPLDARGAAPEVGVPEGRRRRRRRLRRPPLLLARLDGAVGAAANPSSPTYAVGNSGFGAEDGSAGGSGPARLDSRGRSHGGLAGKRAEIAPLTPVTRR